MGGGFNLGKLFGIRIEVDWSWVFIFFLVTWNLGAAFTDLHPDWSFGLSWGLAVVASLLFFASVLAHEFAHSLVARAQGIPVREIRLFLFGGVSNIQREPPSAGAEFLITIVGPITSLVLGGIFTGLGVLAVGVSGDMTSEDTLSALSPAATALLWLGPINIILGIFNLIPGFPLDGGRVLRAILWAATDNLRSATRWASWIGQGIGWLMILTGIAMIFGFTVPFLGGGFIGGLWLAFIGWFLQSAAQQSYQQIAIQDVLQGVPVSRLMQRDARTVSPDATVDDLVHNTIMGTDQHAFPVLRDGTLVGIVCLHDVRRVPREAWPTTAVSDIMTGADRLVTATPDEETSDALNDLASRDVNQLPVVQNGHLVGVLRRQDILRWIQVNAERLR